MMVPTVVFPSPQPTGNRLIPVHFQFPENTGQHGTLNSGSGGEMGRADGGKGSLNHSQPQVNPQSWSGLSYPNHQLKAEDLSEVVALTAPAQQWVRIPPDQRNNQPASCESGVCQVGESASGL